MIRLFVALFACALATSTAVVAALAWFVFTDRLDVLYGAIVPEWMAFLPVVAVFAVTWKAVSALTRRVNVGTAPALVAGVSTLLCCIGLFRWNGGVTRCWPGPLEARVAQALDRVEWWLILAAAPPAAFAATLWPRRTIKKSA